MTDGMWQNQCAAEGDLSAVAIYKNNNNQRKDDEQLETAVHFLYMGNPLRASRTVYDKCLFVFLKHCLIWYSRWLSFTRANISHRQK